MKLRDILTTALILLASDTFVFAATPLDVSMDGSFVKIESKGLTIRDGKPGAIVTIDNIHIPIAPSDTGKLISENNIQTFLGPAVERKYRWDHPRNFALVWTIATLDSGDAVTLKTSIYNGAGAAARIHELVVLDTGSESVRYSGINSNWFVSTLTESLQSGSLADLSSAQKNKGARAARGPAALISDSREFSDFMMLYRDGGATGLAMGAVGKPEADVRFRCQAGARRASLSAVSEMSEVLLEPGCWRDSQEIAILARPYRQATSSLLQWIADTHGHRTHRAPLTGWSSKYDPGTEIAAQHCDAVALAWNGRFGKPADVFQIDDGYQVAPGNWTCNKKFPSGFGDFAKAATNANAAAGIWIAPLVVSETTGIQREHPEWFQKYNDGTLIAGPTNWQTTCNVLDPTQPGAREFLRKTLLDLKKQGFNYFKIDFDQIDSNARLNDVNKTHLQVLRSLHEFYRATLGEDVYLASCSGVNRGAIGYVDASRVGPESYAEWLGASPNCLHDCIVAAGYGSAANGILFATDPDVTYLKPRNKVAFEEWQTWNSFVGLMGGQVFISEPLEKNEYADAARNLEILTPQAAEKGWSFSGATDKEHRRFGLLARRPYGNFVAMLVWNPSSISADAPLGGPGVDQIGKQFHVWSFWDEKYWGTGGPDFVIKGITSHSCKVLRLTPVSTQGPVVIGSTLHISMGAAEIADFSADAHTVTIKLASAGARQGKIIVASAKPLQLGAAEHCTVDAVRERSTGIWEISVSSRERSHEQRIDLAITE